MFKHTAVIAMAGVLGVGILTLSVAGKPSSTSGTWQVDSQRSEAQLITDGTTDSGKKKMNFTLGFARVNGTLKLDDGDPANSKLDLHIYPASSRAPVIGEDGKVKATWLADLANHTMICFHSKKIVRTGDDKLQVTGDLIIVRVDRNVQLEPNEAYSGPVYGPPIVHRAVREATLVFDLAPAGEKDAALKASASTSVSREQFPEMVRTVVATNWPPVVMDEKCQNPSPGTEDYRGFRCTGTFMEAPGLPPPPVQIGEDYPGPSDFNAIVGNQLSMTLQLRLTPKAGGATGM